MAEKKTESKLSLINKLILSYAAIAFFTMAATVFSVIGLQSLNGIVRDIARNDLPFVKLTETLYDSLQAQERSAAKYSLLKSPEFRQLFDQRQKEFKSALETLGKTGSGPLLESLDRNYRDFNSTAEILFQGESDDITHLKNTADKVTTSIDALSASRQVILNDKLENADKKRETTVKWTLLLSSMGFVLALSVMAFFLYTISSSIKKLKRATHSISEGNFDFDPNIPPGDEIGSLAEDFTRMAKRLKILEQMSLDASPLTRLPGNIAIERILTKKLQTGETFAVCYADLDNFKAYSDRYGYIRGSDLIKMTGEVIYEALQQHADENAFVGHIGGDDFIMVVAADEVDAVCQAVIDAFTDEVPQFYTPEDLDQGHIEGPDRYGVIRKFPIMTISIAVVMCQQGEYDSAVKIAKTAAEIKDFAKGKAGSNYFIDRRKRAR
ncbi:MAG: sensor domain-containing diguanylate cyclase [Deltaproteobacteria bacterium]|nr:sensor domain-containing diguanylate cyclase [Deltaproteobacteria bacterium]TLN01878.1 MAG: HAMP domain-containing protein [bacterium]